MSQVRSAGDLSVMQSLSRCCLLASRAQKMACEHCQTSTCWPEVVAAWCPHGRTSSIFVPDVPDTACFLISNEHYMANLFRKRSQQSRAVQERRLLYDTAIYGDDDSRGSQAYFACVSTGQLQQQHRIRSR